MDDFRKRGGGLLLLGTGYDSPAYWIYHAHGFRSLMEESGFMRYSTDDDFEENFFAAGSTKAVDVEWKHWSLMNVLTSVPGVEAMRSLTFGLYGRKSFEGSFLGFIRNLKDDENKQAKLLESESGAIVGCATLMPEGKWLGTTYLLDIFVHQNFVSDYGTLLNALKMPEGKIQCYVDAQSPKEKVEAIEAVGFQREAVLKNQFAWNGEWFDVFLYSKFGE